MMRYARRIGAIVLLCMLGMLAMPVAAQSLDDAKADGVVGERADGYVGVVGSASGNIQGLVDQVNAKRKAKYGEIAKDRGTSVDAVAQIAGKKLIERAPKGTYVMGSNGQWRQK
ncbi:MAG: YdbL family protein [Pseudomonadota bacterium]